MHIFIFVEQNLDCDFVKRKREWVLRLPTVENHCCKCSCKIPQAPPMQHNAARLALCLKPPVKSPRAESDATMYQRQGSYEGAEMSLSCFALFSLCSPLSQARQVKDGHPSYVFITIVTKDPCDTRLTAKTVTSCFCT